MTEPRFKPNRENPGVFLGTFGKDILYDVYLENDDAIRPYWRDTTFGDGPLVVAPYVYDLNRPYYGEGTEWYTKSVEAAKKYLRERDMQTPELVKVSENIWEVRIPENVSIHVIHPSDEIAEEPAEPERLEDARRVLKSLDWLIEVPIEESNLHLIADELASALSTLTDEHTDTWYDALEIALKEQVDKI